MDSSKLKLTKKIALFPWVEVVHKNFQSSFSSDKEKLLLEALLKIIECSQSETEQIIRSEDVFRGQKLLSVLRDYVMYLHLQNILHRNVKKITKKASLSVLSCFLDLGIILSEDDSESASVSFVVSTINLCLKENVPLSWDVLLHCNRLKKSHAKVCYPILKFFLNVPWKQFVTAEEYMKYITLLRLLKVFSPDKYEKHHIVSLAVNMQVSEDVVPFLQSICGDDAFKPTPTSSKEDIAKFLICKKFPPEFFKKIKKVLCEGVSDDDDILLLADITSKTNIVGEDSSSYITFSADIPSTKEVEDGSEIPDDYFYFSTDAAGSTDQNGKRTLKKRKSDTPLEDISRSVDELSLVCEKDVTKDDGEALKVNQFVDLTEETAINVCSITSGSSDEAGSNVVDEEEYINETDMEDEKKDASKDEHTDEDQEMTVEAESDNFSYLSSQASLNPTAVLSPLISPKKSRIASRVSEAIKSINFSPLNATKKRFSEPPPKASMSPGKSPLKSEVEAEELDEEDILGNQENKIDIDEMSSSFTSKVNKGEKDGNDTLYHYGMNATTASKEGGKKLKRPKKRKSGAPLEDIDLSLDGLSIDCKKDAIVKESAETEGVNKLDVSTENLALNCVDVADGITVKESYDIVDEGTIDQNKIIDGDDKDSSIIINLESEIIHEMKNNDAAHVGCTNEEIATENDIYIIETSPGKENVKQDLGVSFDAVSKPVRSPQKMRTIERVSTALTSVNFSPVSSEKYQLISPIKVLQKAGVSPRKSPMVTPVTKHLPTALVSSPVLTSSSPQKKIRVSDISDDNNVAVANITGETDLDTRENMEIDAEESKSPCRKDLNTSFAKGNISHVVNIDSEVKASRCSATPVKPSSSLEEIKNDHNSSIVSNVNISMNDDETGEVNKSQIIGTQNCVLPRQHNLDNSQNASDENRDLMLSFKWEISVTPTKSVSNNLNDSVAEPAICLEMNKTVTNFEEASDNMEISLAPQGAESEIIKADNNCEILNTTGDLSRVPTVVAECVLKVSPKKSQIYNVIATVPAKMLMDNASLSTQSSPKLSVLTNTIKDEKSNSDNELIAGISCLHDSPSKNSESVEQKDAEKCIVKDVPPGSPNNDVLNNLPCTGDSFIKSSPEKRQNSEDDRISVCSSVIDVSEQKVMVEIPCIYTSPSKSSKSVENIPQQIDVDECLIKDIAANDQHNDDIVSDNIPSAAESIVDTVMRSAHSKRQKLEDDQISISSEISNVSEQSLTVRRSQRQRKAVVSPSPSKTVTRSKRVPSAGKTTKGKQKDVADKSESPIKKLPTIEEMMLSDSSNDSQPSVLSVSNTNSHFEQDVEKKSKNTSKRELRFSPCKSSEMSSSVGDLSDFSLSGMSDSGSHSSSETVQEVAKSKSIGAKAPVSSSSKSKVDSHSTTQRSSSRVKQLKSELSPKSAPTLRSSPRKKAAGSNAPSSSSVKQSNKIPELAVVLEDAAGKLNTRSKVNVGNKKDSSEAAEKVQATRQKTPAKKTQQKLTEYIQKAGPSSSVKKTTAKATDNKELLPSSSSTKNLPQSRGYSLRLRSKEEKTSK